MKATILIGISGSGKTTWANEISKNTVNTEIISRDDERKYIMESEGTPFSWANWKWKKEDRVTERCIEKIIAASVAGKDLIIADTNLNDNRRAGLTQRLKTLGYEVEDKVVDIDFQVAVKRDLARPNPVGAQTIAKQWEEFNAGKYGPQKVEYIPGLKEAFIVDLDGTMSHVTDRGPFEWHKVGQDKPNKPVVKVVNALGAAGYDILFTSGRDSVCRDQTHKWLMENFEHHFWLFMRPEADQRKDSIVKRELYDTFINGNWNVVAAIDDRPQVIRLWRSMGVPTFAIGNQLVEF